MSGAERRKARYLCCQALYQWRLTDQEPSEIVHQFLEDNAGILFDEAYFAKLFFGVIGEVAALDVLLNPLIGDTQLTPIEEIALYIGAYELSFIPGMPVPVAIHEALLTSKKYGTKEGYTFVNALLDKLSKQVRDEGK